METQYYNMAGMIYSSEERLDNDTLDRLQEMINRGMENYGLWSALYEGMNPCFDSENESCYVVKNFEVSGEGIERCIRFDIEPVNVKEHLLGVYTPTTIYFDLNVNMDPMKAETARTRDRVQKIKEKQEMDMYMQVYYLSLIALKQYNPLASSVIAFAVDWLTGDTYYEMRDFGDAVSNIETTNTALKSGFAVTQSGFEAASHMWKIYSIASSDAAKEEASESMMAALGSNVHYAINNYDYCMSNRICDPYIIQNIRTLEKKGIGVFIGSEETYFTVDGIAYKISYKESGENYEKFIKGRSESEIKLYQEYYEKLLYGKGDIMFLDMEPDILNECFIGIRNAGLDVDVKGYILNYGRE